MSLLTERGGIPRVQNVSVDTAGRRFTPGGAMKDPQVGRYSFVSNWLQIWNVDAADGLRIFFLEEDFDADANFITVVATTGMWEGPAEVKEFWLKAAANTADVQIVAYQRRS